MKTKLFLTAIAITILSFTSCTKSDLKVSPSSNITKVEKSFSDYNKIQSSGEFKVFIKFSDTEEKVEIETNENLQQHVIIERKGKSLNLKMENNLQISGTPTLNVYITTKNIDSFIGSGESKFIIESILDNNNVNIELSGESEFKGELNINTIDANISGESKLDLRGIAKTFKISSSASSRILDYGFATDQLDAQLSGESEMQLTVNEKMDINASGESIVYYKGAGIVSSQNLSGEAKIVKVE